MTKLEDGITADRADWKFGGDTPKSFDTHVSKSVPLYDEGHNLICDLSDFFVKTDSVVYEIGCSTGTLIWKISEHNSDKSAARFIGVDVEPDMIEFAKNKYAKNKVGISNVEFLVENALAMEFETSDMIICYYTIQFITPSVRQDLVDKIYQKLNWGGAFLLFEKVRGADARFQDMMTALYTDYKIRMGYKPVDIIAKSRSLKGVLEPFSTQGNIDMLNRSGFVDINTIQKYLCFEGFLAIK